jgi:putative phosphoesterase
MRIGLLSDIHANAHALRAVLKSAKEKNVEKLLCCGDYIGYYYEPDKIMPLLDSWDWEGVGGNHEAMLYDWLNKKSKNETNAKYGSGIFIAAEKLEHETIVRYYEMPNTKKLDINNYKILLCHGSPWDRDIYIYPDADEGVVNKMFEYDSDFDVLVYGHTHYPVIWEKNKKKIINPGSVGQPRDRRPGAAWALWDTDINDVTFYREDYDVGPIIEMCRKNNPDIKYLADVLVRK